MSMMDRGLEWLAEQRQAHMSRTVTYSRGETSIEIQATPARLSDDRRELLAGAGLTIVDELLDWLITASDIADDFTLPEDGDRITDGDAVYALLPLPGESSWRYSNSRRLTIRLHTKRVYE